jgi:hypothetical protein
VGLLQDCPCDALGACTELNAVYRRLLKMALEELRLIDEQINQLMAQLLWSGTQALISQSGQSRWVGFPVSERLQHPPGTEAQQIGNEAGQLDMCLFQKRL